MTLTRRKPPPGTRRPWELTSTRTDRMRRVLPFVGLLAASMVLAALPPGEPDRFTGLGLAFLGFVGCAVLIVLVPW
ncbi:MAG TPA: hypothetical protein VK507_04970, partial [Iamia sp.]|nr:hypothetical protein [Iamia sp.]